MCLAALCVSPWLTQLVFPYNHYVEPCLADCFNLKTICCYLDTPVCHLPGWSSGLHHGY